MPPKGRRSVKKPEFICGQCRMEIKENEEYIQCDKCAKNLHAQCSSLDKRQFQHLLDNESEQFFCNVCNEGGDTVKEELSQIKKQLNKLNQLSELNEAMNFMSQKFDEIIRGVAENKRQIDIVQKENRLLKMEIKTLKDSVKLLNDQRVSKDCLISGVQVKENTNAIDTLLEISKGVGLSLNEGDVESAYFLKKKDYKNASEKRTMIVKFETKKSKDKLMQAKSKLKENEKTKSIYVNDCLGKETFNVFNHAKALKKVGYQSVYTFNGRVYVRKSELSKPRPIKSEEDVDDLLMEATTSRLQRRRSGLHVQQPVIPEEDTDDEDNRASFLSPN